MDNKLFYFDNHPQVDVFYFTNDGQAFYTEDDALNHAKSLRFNGQKGIVTKVSRSEFSHTEVPATSPDNVLTLAKANVDTAQRAFDEATTAKAGKKTLNRLNLELNNANAALEQLQTATIAEGS